MKLIKQLLAIATVAFMAAGVAAPAAAQEKPDVLVKRISQEVIETAKNDKAIQSGDTRKVMDLVESKILPYVDSDKMTSIAAGRFWRQATPEQQKQLTAEFRTLLIYTYAGALSQIKDQTVEFKPMRASDSDTDVVVRSQVNQARGEPIQLDYRLTKEASGWKIYDLNVLGAWLIETYKSNFASEISKGGIDGLIKKLHDRNAQLASKPLKAVK
ncbi:ABC transporter substrate-binding protein [Massilia arenosa]|uniref:ABC transporter substrate-binding protein n=1 Tax=Zemynaea arenosa TaxID=2561931 RepID=A0A4Y9RP24_9BURK|nr:ABC transporter substrate-binding protein [Massilia arenosa]TFW10800.1 ABC transporter substrate-binding protein [Massilia arenosa]